MKISVFITSFNQKAFLIEAIESVLNQTLPPSQIIIVDDCSQDSSQELIAGYASRYSNLITPIYHKRNTGVAQARIDALKAVIGDYVTYVDGDDRYLPTKLEKEARLLQENPHAQIAFSNNYYMTADGIRTGIWADGETLPQGDVFCQTFARDFPRSSLFRMELVEYHAWRKVGFHDPDLHLYEDFDMRIRLTKRYLAVYCDEPLSEIRVHNAGLASSKASHHLTALDYIYRKNRPLLDELSISDRRDVQRKLGRWMAGIARRAAEQALQEGQCRRDSRGQALKYYLRCLKYQPSCFDYKLILKILLPHRAYRSSGKHLTALRRTDVRLRLDT